MDVFHVGASAPKAPESRNVERDAAERPGSRSQTPSVGSDAFASSADAAAVKKRVDALSASNDVREDVIKGVRELLGKGLLDTSAAANRAAQGILDS